MFTPSNFFNLDTAPGALLYSSFSPWMVALSVAIAVVASISALYAAGLARRASDRRQRLILVGTGAVALGGGIWAMHFIGMQAFEFCTQVSYSHPLTLLSMAPGLGAALLALHLLAQNQISQRQLLAGGTLIGTGIGTMHYSGMAAMIMSGSLRYDPGWFALSIVTAIALAIFALWLRFRLRRLRHRLPGWAGILVSGTVLGGAVAGMHYTGTAAARVVNLPVVGGTPVNTDPSFLTVAVTLATLSLTLLVAVANGLLRYQQLYRQIESKEARLQAILDTAVDGIVTIDRHGLVRSFNNAAERLFGWQAEDVVGRNINMLMPEPHRTRHDSYLSNYMESGVARIIGTGREVTAMRRDGSLFPIRLAIGRTEVPGETLFVGFITDISQYKELEQALRDSRDRAELAATSKTAFLANMSHEIRTPMNAIIGFTEQLLDTSLDTQQRRHLDTVRRSARSLLGLLNDILDTAKLERGAMEIEHVDFSLHDVVYQVAASLRLSAETKGLTLDIDYAPSLGEHFRGDPLRVQQVLTNLLGNAIKFTERGSVKVSAEGQAGAVRLIVTDTGIGIPSDRIARIFEPFAQADVSTSRRFGGTGLGTTIARQLIELMHGRLDVESEVGAGSRFIVELPLERGGPIASTPATTLPTLPPLRILVADDVPQNLELLTLALGRAGHQLVTASDGEEALTLFATGRFDVVLMDVQMPHIDGLEAARGIRAHERQHGLSPTPIIALTASVLNQDRIAAREAGMDGFASKPLDIPRLLAEIARATGHAVAGHNPAHTQLPCDAIDWQRGIALWGSADALEQALRRFVDAHASSPDALSRLAMDADHTSLERAAHRLRGAAANLCLPIVSSIAERIEGEAGAAHCEHLAPLFHTLRDAMDAVIAALALRNPGGTEAPPPAAGQADVTALASHLHDLLEHGELDEDMLRELLSTLHADGRRPAAEAIERAIDDFEFQTAQRELLALYD
ncbi:MHYT domain-containing protein [Zoogloea sp. LCSB751]|uniref:MHYT domain-containing protein n=1 Tax=Zoogloea sp. LCSB751 TaxID=1965277 RepID=UPI0009A54189|nr:MHYT domain-containing protein [Zoogloea sp. LCSB751]